MITKDEFLAYEAVRKSGVTNMWDVKTVMVISDLTKEQCFEIMDKYSELKTKYMGADK